ncbi:UDP binding domain-containing protein [Sporosarcina sp. FSL K6-2383]|uniref:UDP binding domain-containing protein n=1 Tax=Sporosarcina sp. FSL K6-2383 TaxID=2921556 RepID=UPI00315A1EA0
MASNKYSATSLIDCVRDANAVLLVTEWEEFIEADWTTIHKLVKEQIIFDGRNA